MYPSRKIPYCLLTVRRAACDVTDVCWRVAYDHQSRQTMCMFDVTDDQRLDDIYILTM